MKLTALFITFVASVALAAPQLVDPVTGPNKGIKFADIACGVLTTSKDVVHPLNAKKGCHEILGARGSKVMFNIDEDCVCKFHKNLKCGDEVPRITNYFFDPPEAEHEGPKDPPKGYPPTGWKEGFVAWTCEKIG